MATIDPHNLTSAVSLLDALAVGNVSDYQANALAQATQATSGHPAARSIRDNLARAHYSLTQHGERDTAIMWYERAASAWLNTTNKEG